MTLPLPRTITIGTRASALARRQTRQVAAALAERSAGLDVEEIPFITTGDVTLERPLPEIGGKGVFTAELEQALRSGEIDLAVHSLKDLPVQPPPGIAIGAICFREDARDVLIAPRWGSLGALPSGARVGTSSTRRMAQLRALRSDLDPCSIRGNVDTRLRKVIAGEFEAIILAAAGVLRLGLGGAITSYLTLEQMLPAPGQGALAVQCRSDDEPLRKLLALLDDGVLRDAVTAERTFLAALGGGCSAPVAAHAVSEAQDALHLIGMVTAPDGSRTVRTEGSARRGEAVALGHRLAAEAISAGVGEWL
jgi:hydroxymethylbilane synthase